MTVEQKQFFQQLLLRWETEKGIEEKEVISHYDILSGSFYFAVNRDCWPIMRLEPSMKLHFIDYTGKCSREGLVMAPELLPAVARMGEVFETFDASQKVPTVH